MEAALLLATELDESINGQREQWPAIFALTKLTMQ